MLISEYSLSHFFGSPAYVNKKTLHPLLVHQQYSVKINQSVA